MKQGQDIVIGYYCDSEDRDFSLEELEELYRSLADSDDTVIRADIPRVRKAVRRGKQIVCPICRDHKVNPIISCPECGDGKVKVEYQGTGLGNCKNCGREIQKLEGSKEEVDKKAVKDFFQQNPDATPEEAAAYLGLGEQQVRRWK